MLRTNPPGIHSSTESINEKVDISPPSVVRREERARAVRGRASSASAASAASSRATSATRPLLPPAPARTKTAPLDVCAPANVSDRHRALINSVSASVVSELRQTVGWDLDIKEDLHVHSIDRKTLCRLVRRDYGVNRLQAWALCRVQGVIYLPSQKKLLVVEEVARSWHPQLLAHEVAKGIVRVGLAKYAGQQVLEQNTKVLDFEDKLDQVYRAEYDERRSVRAIAAFHAAHAESVARKHAPTTHTAPIRQKLWAWLIYLTMHSFFAVRSAGAKLADDIERILDYDLDAVNTIYANGRLSEQFYGGLGKVHIDAAASYDLEKLKKLGYFLHQLNHRRGAVILQINLGSTRTFTPAQ